jgi:hypothetical protein
MPYDWLSRKQLDQIPDKTKQEIVEAVREGSKRVRLFGNGMVIIYGETHMAHRKRFNRKRDIEWKARLIAKKTGADYEEIKDRFIQEMTDLRFISGV